MNEKQVPQTTTDASSSAATVSYRDAGVDIDAGNALVDRIKPLVASTMRPEVMAGVGGFGALVGIDLKKYREPVLVSGTDGVGTKLLLARQLQQHDTIGIDLVAMCANDILVQGAEPLFFLDYFACGQLEVDAASAVVAGIAEGCRQAGCALVGGETAEMPGMYDAGDYDLAGFVVGVADRAAVIDGSQVKAGHRLIGLASSGPHSNGYSLIRRLIELRGADLQQSCGEQTLAQALMAPTRIYARLVLDLIQQFPIHAMSHITGGGLILFHCIRPGEFQHWVAVADRMREEAYDEARTLLGDMASRLEAYCGVKPETVIVEGEPRDALRDFIDGRDDLFGLVLGAGSEGDPGPLVDYFAGELVGNMRCPVMLVPGSMTYDQVDAIA